ncbi:Uncharacterised protein [BD1-7 clade bacterium]|uniref:Lipocalin-like domain-containing protein n=1 Tax=BD1-7 clade bacterium TaxID=2029982 RepID=A0A5S9PGU2_9GAMM|nr:Uncharacterised protein [BD1-7 clade bacterium]CAA0103207.1 Uncharacterised protein [BD1-7 clade bacterium]
MLNRCVLVLASTLIFAGCIPDVNAPTEKPPEEDKRFNKESYTPLETNDSDLTGTWLLFFNNYHVESNVENRHSTLAGNVRHVC